MCHVYWMSSWTNPSTMAHVAFFDWSTDDMLLVIIYTANAFFMSLSTVELVLLKAKTTGITVASTRRNCYMHRSIVSIPVIKLQSPKTNFGLPPQITCPHLAVHALHLHCILEFFWGCICQVIRRFGFADQGIQTLKQVTRSLIDNHPCCQGWGCKRTTFVITGSTYTAFLYDMG